MIRCGLVIVLCLCLYPYPGRAQAATIEQIQANGHLQVASSLAPATNLVPGEKAMLTLTVATDSWFTGGTRITLPEVAGLVILQTEQFASNASENRDGDSWVVQRWTLDVYAQRAGNFTIGPIALQVHINDGDGGTLTGIVYSPPVEFTARVPPALAGIPHWVAAPYFSVSQRFDRSLENLQAGDAFEREVVFEASDVMAMMLPVYNSTRQKGLAAYPEPPRLLNSHNRGESRAVRTQRVSYIVEAPGQYLLPAEDYYWWNTGTGELQLLSLPPVTITAVGAPPIDNSPPPWHSHWRRWAMLAAGGLTLGVIGWICWRRQRRHSLPGQLNIRLQSLWQRLKDLRKPALADSLNPGNIAGE